MNSEIQKQLENEVKFFAKRNMCASCYVDIDEYPGIMEDLICGDFNDCLVSTIYNECINDLEYSGIPIDDEVQKEALRLLKIEAKYWLSDYRKHRKDYE